MAKAQGASHLTVRRMGLLMASITIGCVPAVEEPAAPEAQPPRWLVQGPGGHAPVRSRPGRPSVPREMRETASVQSTALGLRLINTEPSAFGWREHRALVEDESTGDVRAYAVGDLLPRGALLVGIESGAIRIFAADAVLLRLDRQRSEVVADLRVRRRAGRRGPRVGAAPSLPLKRAIQAAVGDLASADPERLAQAVEALVASGQGMAGLIVAHVADPSPVGLPEAWILGRRVRSQTVGDRVVAIIEAITGQSFGDPTENGRRGEVVAAWLHWGGLD